MNEKTQESTFQTRVRTWLLQCFGEEIANNIVERNHGFFEEAAERVQASGMTVSEAHQLVDYVWNRPVGERKQETGGVFGCRLDAAFQSARSGRQPDQRERYLVVDLYL